MDLANRIERRLRLRDLQVLMAVAQTGSMRKAAALLNTTQPSVSRAIAELEQTTGARLLERHPGGVEPTACGRALLDGGIAMFDDLHQAVKNIEFLTDPTSGEVRLGIVPAFGASFLTAAIDQFSRRYPRVRFEIKTGLVETLHRHLLDRTIDLAISARFGRLATERVDFQNLFDGSFVVAASAKNPWSRRRKIELADLANEQWTLPSPESALGSAFLEAFTASGLDYPRAIVMADPLDVRIGLLETGRFLTMFDPAVLRFASHHRALVALPVALPIVAAPIGISTLNARALSPVSKLFIEHARELAKRLTRKK
jgi:DNA-binding transcriptional LysR family regulator